MKIKSTFVVGLILAICSCSKQTGDVIVPKEPSPVTTFIQYRIPKDQHYSEQSAYMPVEYDELKFIVKFDSSAVYTTKDPANQYDINKLYGFADNNALHQQFSARIGWRWSDGALHLFGYIYNNGVVSYEELGTISIGAGHSCSIKVSANSYIFLVDGISVTMPRLSTTVKAKGYKLFPYFGGDETAPHDISIWISEN
jgi:hypothetical protein